MIDWQKPKRIHLTGIKGVGMTALACCLKDLGMKITGSDTAEEFVTDQVLQKKGILWQNFSEKNINKKIELLVFTAAHKGEDNPEVKKAKTLGIKILSQGQALGELMSLKKIGVSVCGVGGKTTTASMIAHLLDSLGGKPSFAIGVGMIKPLGVPGRFDKEGKIFIAEADEYFTSPSDPSPKFFYQKPKVIVLTNLEYDHPDVYANFQETKATFKSFIQKLPDDGLLVLNGDSEKLKAFTRKLDVPLQTIGFSPGVDWQITKDKITKEGVNFSLRYKGLLLEKILLSVPGRFNILNATASLAVANFLGFSLQKTAGVLKNFKGTKRRFEFIKAVKGRRFFDDYAHHPKQLKSTLQAVKRIFPLDRVWAIFQSHTFSRTRALFKEFSQSFSDADFVIIAPIYPSAREKKDPEISGRILAEAIGKFHSRVFYQATAEQAAKLVKEKSRRGDIILTLGAGDIFNWQRVITKTLKDER